MGLAASQARFLAITSRKMNCEFQSMQIAQQKLSVTRDLQKAAQDYQSSLNATKLIWDTSDTCVYVLYYDIMMNPSVLNEFDPFFITDVNGRIVLTKPMFQAAVESGVIDSSGNPMGLWVDKRKKLGDSGYITRENGEASGKLGAGEFKEVYNSDGNICGYEYANKDKANDGSRNAFLYQLGKVNKIDMNMADNIINLGEAGYTKSGIGGKIYSKNSANAMNTFALKEYMKTADYSMRLASGNSIPKDKTAHDLVYGLNILSILNDSPPVKSEFGKVEKERQREDDVGLGTVGVEIVIGIGIVFQQDGGIFLLCDGEVFLVFRLTHHKGLGARGRVGRLRRIAMDRDEYIGVVSIGDVGALAQFDELVGLARIDHLHIGEDLFDIGAKLQRDGQIKRLLGRHLAQGTGVLASVTRINDDGLYLLALLCPDAQRQHKNQEKNTKSGNLSFYHIEFVYLCAKKNYLCSGFQSHKSNRFHLVRTHDT